ncbi:hypothetical protein AAFF_G00172830, partial [Aldrovandia affinis]
FRTTCAGTGQSARALLCSRGCCAGRRKDRRGTAMDAVNSARPGERDAAVLPGAPQSNKQDQEKLSGVVKSVHRKLRRKYREVGDFEKIWREHCEDEETLSEYALAMKNLADNHWAKSCEGEGRIEWCRSVCQEYFLDGGMKKVLEKDEKSARLSMPLSSASPACAPPHQTNGPHRLSVQTGRIRLLDVGSCFNPFLKFDEFLTVGIDIVPAVESVYKCDFLNLQLQPPLQLEHDAVDAFLLQLRSPIDALPGELFQVAVFSLLLSYFPSPYQRWLCCEKAHALLALHGLLLIITPDSSHQNRHAPMMASWRVAVETLGFRRYKYVKFPHMHLLAFRKVSLTTSGDLVSRNYPEMLYIPQDFSVEEEEEERWPNTPTPRSGTRRPSSLSSKKKPNRVGPGRATPDVRVHFSPSLSRTGPWGTERGPVRDGVTGHSGGGGGLWVLSVTRVKRCLLRDSTCGSSGTPPAPQNHSCAQRTVSASLPLPWGRQPIAAPVALLARADSGCLLPGHCIPLLEELDFHHLIRCELPMAAAVRNLTVPVRLWPGAPIGGGVWLSIPGGGGRESRHELAKEQLFLLDVESFLQKRQGFQPGYHGPICGIYWPVDPVMMSKQSGSYLERVLNEAKCDIQLLSDMSVVRMHSPRAAG